MVIEPPEFDPDLKSHNAVVFDDGSEDVCHATVMEYTGGQRFVTECGMEVGERNTDPREVFADADIRMCGECWPLEDLEEDLTGSECP